MFLKLIKHDLKTIFKSTRIFIILLLVSILIFNLTSYVPEYIINDQGNITQEILPSALFMTIHNLAYFGIYISLFGLIFMAILATWRHFQTNFYGDEAYLTHTLPIPRSTLWIAKACSVFITVAGIILVFMIGVLLLTLSVNGMQLLNRNGLIGGNAFGVGPYYYVEALDPGFYLSLVFCLFAQLSFIIFCGYSGIIIGHLTNNHQGLWSILSGFGLYIIGGILLLVALYLLSFIDPSMRYLFGDPAGHQAGLYDGIDFAIRIFFNIGLIYLVYTMIQFFVDQKLLRKGINLN